MTEKILVVILPLLFLGTFVTRNLIVKSITKQQVKASDSLSTISIIVNTLCILVTINSTYSEYFYRLMGAILPLRSPVISYTGLFLFGTGSIIGWFISAQLKESWRVGVHENQETELIRSGIYAYIRNPYFLCYYFMFFGLFLVRPSLILMFLVIAIVTIFHKMVLKEESYLLATHGKEYEIYKNTTGRYLPCFVKLR